NSRHTLYTYTTLFRSSLAANGSDFVINPGGTIVSASSVNCTAGFDFDSAVVTLSAPLAPGNYTIEIANGSDGNSVLDNCSTPIPDRKSTRLNSSHVKI